MQVYNEKEQEGQKEMQNIHFEEKKNTRKCNVGVKSYAQGDEKFKEKPDTMWNKGCSNIRARLYPILQPVTERGLKKFPRPKQQKKSYANIIQEEGQVSDPESKGTWKLQPSGSGFSVKNIGKSLWNLPQ